MKRIIIIILVLTMLLSMSTVFAVPLSADETVGEVTEEAVTTEPVVTEETDTTPAVTAVPEESTTTQPEPTVTESQSEVTNSLSEEYSVLDDLLLATASDVVASGYCGSEGDGTNLSWKLTENGTLVISGRGAIANYLITPWGNYVHMIKTIKLEEGVTSICAFFNCDELTSITIPNSVTNIGDGTFMGCKALTSVTIPNSVVSIGNRAFERCTSLTSVIIPNSVKSIGYEAFLDCKALTSVTIPNSVVSIGNRAFVRCTSLSSVTIPNSVKSIGDGTFLGCEALTSVDISDSVTSIDDGAFYSCYNLTSVTIPNGVTSIGNEAFGDCKSLTSVTIPNSVINIGDWAFSYCSSLTYITIPNSVTSIGANEFYDCVSLTNIYCEAESRPNGWHNDWNKKCPATVHWGYKGGSNQSGEFNGHTYKIVDTGISWTEANEECKKVGGHLATINSVEEQNYIQSLFNSNSKNCYWIGGQYVDNSWRWITSEPFLYQYWAPNEPNNQEGQETFLHMYGQVRTDGEGLKEVGQWNDASNNGAIYADEFYSIDNFGYICEWDNQAIDPKPDPDDDKTVYTNFGKLNVLGYSTYFGTITVEDITYKMSDEFKRLSEEVENAIVWPDDNMKYYIYAAFNLNSNNEIKDCKLLTGEEWTLESYDSYSRMVKLSRLDGGIKIINDYKISEAATHFPHNEISQWVGDKVRAYIIGNTIFEAIHIEEGNGTITDIKKDIRPYSVCIDGTWFSPYADDDRLNRIIELIEKNSFVQFVTYDGVLVGLDSKQLKISCNTKDGIYMTGQDITLCFEWSIIDSLDSEVKCIETSYEDFMNSISIEAYNYGDKIEDFMIRVSEDSLSVYYTIWPQKAGVTDVYIQDKRSNTTQELTFEIREDDYKTHRADYVESIDEVAWGDKDDHYNLYIDGIYITDFKAIKRDNGSYDYEFDAYNTKPIIGTVEVIDKISGELLSVDTIDAFEPKAGTSIKNTITSGWEGMWDVLKWDALSFKASFQSKHSPIRVNVPENAFVVVTNSINVSDFCLLINSIDLVVDTASIVKGVIDDVNKLDKTTEEISKLKEKNNYTDELAKIAFQVNKEIEQKMALGDKSNYMKKFRKALTKKMTKVALDDGVEAVLKGLIFDFSEFLEALEIDWTQIIIDSKVDAVFSMAQDTIITCGGPAGQALKWVFNFTKFTNLADKLINFTKSYKSSNGYIIVNPLEESGIMYDISSVNGIILTSSSGLPSGTVLHTAELSVDLIDISQIDKSTYNLLTLYDVKLLNCGEAIKPNFSVKLSFPISDISKSYAVAHQNADGTWSKLNSKLIDNMVTVSTKILGTFAILEIKTPAYEEPIPSVPDTYTFTYIDDENHLAGGVLARHIPDSITKHTDGEYEWHYCMYCKHEYGKVRVVEADDTVELVVDDPVEAGDAETIPDVPVTELEIAKPVQDSNPPTGIAIALLPMALVVMAAIASKKINK